MQVSVPLHVLDGHGQASAGTGFVASYRGRLWLCTAAHIAHGLPHVHGRWMDWPSALGRDHSDLSIPLFREEGSTRIPTFAYIGDEAQIGDFMAVPITPAVQTRLGATTHTLKFVTPEVGMACQLFGYPVACRGPEQVTPMRVLEAQTLLSVTPAGAKGTSGGPILTTTGGYLVGLNIGFDAPATHIGKAISAAAMCMVIEQNLQRFGNL